jgi:hypothetical protein
LPFLVRVFAGGLAVGVLVADEAGVGLALVVRLFAFIEQFDVLVGEIDLGGLFFAGGEAKRAEQEGEEPVHARSLKVMRGFSTSTAHQFVAHAFSKGGWLMKLDKVELKYKHAA